MSLSSEIITGQAWSTMVGSYAVKRQCLFMPVKQVLEGTKVPVRVWTDELDSATRQQLVNVASLPIVFGHVAAMPDVHLGKGATVGSVIATKSAIVPAAVGVDIGCFVGETKIPLLNGTQRSLQDLSKEVEPFWVYSIGPDGGIAPGRARALKTRAYAELVVVTVSGGDEIVCTPDHKFMLSDGTYREAKDLRFNTSLMPLYRRWQTRDGYESCSNGKSGGARLTHELVYEGLFGPIPEGFVIHHKDHVHFNNSPDNLCLMEAGEHSAHHRATGRKFQNACPAFQAKRMAGITRRASDPVKRAQMATVGIANITAFMSERKEEFLRSVSGNGARGAPYLTRFNTSPRACSDCGEVHSNPAALRWHKQRAHSYNHKVISVRTADYRADVYCLTVEEHHNFALAAGVFVHNCGMCAAQTTLTAEDLHEKLLHAVFHQISRDVPVGFEQHSPERAHAGQARRFERGLRAIRDKHPDLMKRMGKHSDWTRQLGTLGGGNHFIEVCLDEQGFVWVMLHSGSRGIGNAIGTYFIELARNEMLHLDAQLPDRDLAYLTEGTVHFDDYVEAVGWAQDYARENRALMLETVLDAIRRHAPPFEVSRQAVQCHHNYVQRERHFGEDVWVTRKGAIRAGKDDLGIIPGCFAAGTRVLMATGLYRDIESIAPGDRVIAGDGSTTTVVNTFTHGNREVWTYRNNAFHAATVATPGHSHFVGDLSSANIQAEGRLRVVDRLTRNGQSKYQWRPLSDLSRLSFTLLMPKGISFDDMPSSFRLESEGFVFEPSYSLGYVFGTFLGDGTCRYKNGDGGQVSWSLGLDEGTIAARIVQASDEALGVKAKLYKSAKCILVVVHNARLARFFAVFGKKSGKAIPEELWCSHREYATGLADGLIDSDGHVNAKTQKLTNTSPKLIEQYGVLHYLLHGYFPSVSVRAPSAGGLRGCNGANCKSSYRATSLRLPPIASKHQLIELLQIDKVAKNADVYDIEVAHHEHSFIANNAIVHNSMGAKSYIVRGKGNPESFESSAHGAGRRLSRNAAQRQYTAADLAAQTEGVICRKDRGVVDEIPAAYKDIDRVMANQTDLVEVMHTLRQVLCVKG